MRFHLVTLLAVASGILLLPLLASRSVAQSPINEEDSSVTRRPYGSLEAHIQTDRTQYNPNRAVQVTMTLTNLNSNPHFFATGGVYQYDFTVREARSSRAVFTLSKNRPRLPKGSFTINGNGTRTYEELWDQTDDSGNRLTQGIYVIEASIYPQNKVSQQIFLGSRDGGARPPSEREPKPNPNAPTPTRRQVSSTVTSDQTNVVAGAKVSFTYTIQNSTATPLNLRFASGKQFDATVTAPNQSLFWQLSREMGYLESFTQLTIPPNQKQVFSGSWTVPKDMVSGRYTLYCFLTPLETRGAAYLPASVTINVGGSSSTQNGPPFSQNTSQISARILVSPSGSRYVGEKVLMYGKYNGREGGTGAPPVTKNDWVFAAEGVTLYVTGHTPTVAVGDNITLTGTVRQATDGRIYIEIN